MVDKKTLQEVNASLNILSDFIKNTSGPYFRSLIETVKDYTTPLNISDKEQLKKIKMFLEHYERIELSLLEKIHYKSVLQLTFNEIKTLEHIIKEVKELIIEFDKFNLFEKTLIKTEQDENKLEQEILKIKLKIEKILKDNEN
ncbi:hypothetical protein K9M18_02365 [Candidatus Woesearchaeota archaeon]|nr:hypothetical protein [Candidatus Woesearchaeota archaeon]MCF8013825.1 hypothetical protein [Candidatus Woesearchaeota archaeon]